VRPLPKPVLLMKLYVKSFRISESRYVAYVRWFSQPVSMYAALSYTYDIASTNKAIASAASKVPPTPPSSVAMKRSTTRPSVPMIVAPRKRDRTAHE